MYLTKISPIYTYVLKNKSQFKIRGDTTPSLFTIIFCSNYSNFLNDDKGTRYRYIQNLGTYTIIYNGERLFRFF